MRTVPGRVCLSINPSCYASDVYFLFRLHFFPQLIIEVIRIVSEVVVDFALVAEVFVAGEECGVLLQFFVQHVVGAGVGRGVGDVFKVAEGDVRAAEEVDPELGVPLVSGVSGDDPGVQPEVGSLLRKDVFQFVAQILGSHFFLDVEHLAGVDDTDGSLAADHLVADLVYHVGLDERLLVDKLALCGLQLVDVSRVHGEAQELQGDHEGVADAVLHEDFAFVAGIPEIGPFGGRIDAQFFDELRVVEDAYRAPGVGDGIFVLRVKCLRHLDVPVADVLVVRDVVEVDLGQEVVLNHLLDHVVRGADHVVGDGSGLDDGIHFLVGLKHVVGDVDSRLLLEVFDDGIVDVFTPVVDIELVGVLRVVADDRGSAGHNQDKGGGDAQDGLADVGASLSSGGKSCDLLAVHPGDFFLGLLRREVGDDKEHQHRHEDDAGEGVHGGLDTPAYLAVDEGGQGVDARTSCKVGDDKVIQRHGEGHEEAGEDARKDVREHHLEKCLHRVCAQVKGRLVGAPVGLLELRHDAQDDIGHIEGDVGDQHRLKAQGDAEGDKGQHQGDTGDDIGVQHWDVVHRHDDVSGQLFHAADADGGRRAEDGGNQGRDQGD